MKIPLIAATLLKNKLPENCITIMQQLLQAYLPVVSISCIITHIFIAPAYKRLLFLESDGSPPTLLY